MLYSAMQVLEIVNIARGYDNLRSPWVGIGRDTPGAFVFRNDLLRSMKSYPVIFLLEIKELEGEQERYLRQRKPAEAPV